MHFLFLGIGELSFWLQAWRGIMMLLCKLIYKLIAGLFQLFITVSRLNILSSDEIAPIYQRVTMILTIVMVFYVTFEFVKYVIQPDTFSDKEKGAGKLVYRMVLVVVLIAFVPKIFSLGYQFQNKIIENQVLSKIILGKKSMDFKTYGYDFSANMLSLFYNVDEEVCGSKCSEAESLVNTNLERLRKSGDTKYLDDSLNEANKVTIDGETRQRPIINFDGLFAVVVGGFIVYILILYSIDIGTRYAQLIFLQIMSPVAIISYISPKKDGMFSKWTKQCVTTYIDLFIRLAIIYFVLLIVQVLGTAYDNGNLFEGLGEISGFIKVLCYIVLVMGLLVFANKAPKMLSELLPSSGAAGIGFGLGAKDRFEPTTKAIKGAAKGLATGIKTPINAGKRVSGAVTGAAIGLGSSLRNRKNISANNKTGFGRGISTMYSASKAMASGVKAGASKGGSIGKANAAARQSIQKDVEIADKGGTVLGHDFRGSHYQQKSTDIKRKVEGLEAISKAKDSVSSAVKNMKVMKTMEAYKNDWINRGIGDASVREKAMKDVEKASRVYAVSNKTTADEVVFKNEIERIVRNVYNIPQNGPYTQEQLSKIREAENTISNLQSNMEIGSVNWETVEIAMKEAERISKGKTFTDDQGNTITVGAAGTISKFAEKIGDVADEANKEIAKTNSEDATRKANANANAASGGKK